MRTAAIAAIATSLMASLVSATTAQDITLIDGLFTSPYAQVATGYALGTISKMIQLDPSSDTCFSQMWGVGEGFIDISKFNRVRGQLDDFVFLPLTSALLVFKFAQATLVCLYADPNFTLPKIPFLMSPNVQTTSALWTELTTFNFLGNLGGTVIGIALVALDLIGDFDYFFLGKLIGSSATFFGVVAWNSFSLAEGL